MMGKAALSANAAMSASVAKQSGRITVLRPSSDRSFGGIVRILPAKSIDRSSDSMRSSRWCPSAIFVQPISAAALYRIPRRRREHTAQAVAPSGVRRFTTE
jgi:hypothetical protein